MNMIIDLVESSSLLPFQNKRRESIINTTLNKNIYIFISDDRTHNYLWQSMKLKMNFYLFLHNLSNEYL